MSKATLLELADRVEKAGGPDRELDVAINIAVFSQIAKPDAPPYTASFDAAMTLVPANFSCEISHSAAPGSSPNMQFTRCRLWDWRRGPLAIDPSNEWKSEGNRPLPLSIASAALRARAQQESSDA